MGDLVKTQIPFTRPGTGPEIPYFSSLLDAVGAAKSTNYALNNEAQHQFENQAYILITFKENVFVSVLYRIF